MVTGSRYTVETKPLVQTVVSPVETWLTDDETLFISPLHSSGSRARCLPSADPSWFPWKTTRCIRLG
jgi:hypothetical protein